MYLTPNWPIWRKSFVSLSFVDFWDLSQWITSGKVSMGFPTTTKIASNFTRYLQLGDLVKLEAHLIVYSREFSKPYRQKNLSVQLRMKVNHFAYFHCCVDTEGVARIQRPKYYPLTCWTLSYCVFKSFAVHILNHLSLVFQLLFSYKLKTFAFTVLFLLCLYSPRLSQSGLISPVLTKLCCFISYSFRCHSPNFIHAIFIVSHL